MNLSAIAPADNSPGTNESKIKILDQKDINSLANRMLFPTYAKNAPDKFPLSNDASSSILDKVLQI